MAQKKEFGEGPIFVISNYIWWFFLGNLYFLICSVPLIFTIMTFRSKLLTDGILFFTISLSLEAPAVTALCSVMGKLVRENDLDISKDYFKAYKVNFLQSLFLGVLQSLFLFALIEDIKIFRMQSYGKILIPIFIMSIFMIILISLYIFPILSRFYLKSLDILKLSLYYCIRKVHITILNLCIIIIGTILMQYIPIISIFLSSILCYLIMFFEKDIIELLEKRLEIDNTTQM